MDLTGRIGFAGLSVLSAGMVWVGVTGFAEGGWMLVLLGFALWLSVVYVLRKDRWQNRARPGAPDIELDELP